MLLSQHPRACKTPLQRLFISFLRSFFIFFQNKILYSVTSSRVNRMCNIAIFPIRSFPAGHCNKQAFLALDHFDVMNNKFIINCNGHNGLHFSILCYLADSNVCDIHSRSSFLINCILWAEVSISVCFYRSGSALYGHHMTYLSFVSTTIFTSPSPTWREFARIVSWLSTMQFSIYVLSPI